MENEMHKSSHPALLARHIRAYSRMATNMHARTVIMMATATTAAGEAWPEVILDCRNRALSSSVSCPV